MVTAAALKHDAVPSEKIYGHMNTLSFHVKREHKTVIITKLSVNRFTCRNKKNVALVGWN
jgi:hypothetical protein